MAVPDPLVALVAYLQSDPDIALVTNRVFGQELPAGESVNMPRAVVLVQDAGGFGKASDSRLYEPRVYIRTYGATLVEAKQLQLLCHTALIKLKRSLQGTALLYRAILESGSNYTRDPVTTWFFYFSTWRLATTYDEV